MSGCSVPLAAGSHGCGLCAHLPHQTVHWIECCLHRWGKPVIVFGEPGMRKDHPVVKFLADENKCKSLSIYRPGCDFCVLLCITTSNGIAFSKGLHPACAVAAATSSCILTCDQPTAAQV